MLFEIEFAANSRVPPGSVATANGLAPAAKGEPVIAVSAPLLPIENPSTTSCAVSATYRCPLRSTVTEFGNEPAPIEKGEPGTAVNAPLLPMANAATVPCDGLPRNRKSPLGVTANERGLEAGVMAKGEP